MVGLFPSLARRIRAQGIPLTVLELRPEKVTREAEFEVTLDPERLRGCTRILCTASTLINGTLDSVMESVTHAQHVALIGPSASCFPDPLFARGIHAVGGPGFWTPPCWPGVSRRARRGAIRCAATSSRWMRTRVSMRCSSRTLSGVDHEIVMHDPGNSVVTRNILPGHQPQPLRRVIPAALQVVHLQRHRVIRKFSLPALPGLAEPPCIRKTMT
jgi:hypothetical protein